MLEEAANDTGAVDVLAQLKLARYLTGLPPEELLIDMNTLSNLDTLHERHRHVSTPSPSTLLFLETQRGRAERHGRRASCSAI